MINSAEKGQILKKPSRRQGAGTRTLYSPLKSAAWLNFSISNIKKSLNFKKTSLTMISLDTNTILGSIIFEQNLLQKVKRFPLRGFLSHLNLKKKRNTYNFNYELYFWHYSKNSKKQISPISNLQKSESTNEPFICSPIFIKWK